MNENTKPNVRLYLTGDLYNSLMSVIAMMTESKREIGETAFSEQAEKLKTKIHKHSHVVKTKNGERVSIHFFEREAAILLKLLLLYNSIREKTPIDFFANLKQLKERV